MTNKPSALEAATVQQIEDNILEADTLIRQFEGLDDPGETMNYLQKLCSVQSLCSETQASAKYRLLEAQDEWTERILRAEINGYEGKDVTVKSIRFAPSIAKMRADAKCRQMHYLYERALRLSSSLSHTIDAVRTKISYIKQEMYNGNQ